MAFNSKPVREPPESEDEGDALLTAAALRSLSQDAASFALPDRRFRKEGWIFGVPFDHQSDIKLTVEQALEIERGLSDEEPFASADEVSMVFKRLTK